MSDTDLRLKRMDSEKIRENGAGRFSPEAVLARQVVGLKQTLRKGGVSRNNLKRKGEMAR